MDDVVVGSVGFMEKFGFVGGGFGEDLVNVFGVEDGVDVVVIWLVRGFVWCFWVGIGCL